MMSLSKLSVFVLCAAAFTACTKSTYSKNKLDPFEEGGLTGGTTDGGTTDGGTTDGGTTTPVPIARCQITLDQACLLRPDFNKLVFDDSAQHWNSQASCLQRAEAYKYLCGDKAEGGATFKAEYLLDDVLVESRTAVVDTKCRITLDQQCAQHPNLLKGSFNDRFDNSNLRQARCLQRAADYGAFCDASGNSPVDFKAEFLKNGIVIAQDTVRINPRLKKDCSYLGRTIDHQASLVVYKFPTSRIGESCDDFKKTLVCDDGVLNQSLDTAVYRDFACAPEAPVERAIEMFVRNENVKKAELIKDDGRENATDAVESHYFREVKGYRFDANNDRVNFPLDRIEIDGVVRAGADGKPIKNWLSGFSNPTREIYKIAIDTCGTPLRYSSALLVMVNNKVVASETQGMRSPSGSTVFSDRLLRGVFQNSLSAPFNSYWGGWLTNYSDNCRVGVSCAMPHRDNNAPIRGISLILNQADFAALGVNWNNLEVGVVAAANSQANLSLRRVNNNNDLLPNLCIRAKVTTRSKR